MSYRITVADAAGIFREYGPFDTFPKALGSYLWLRQEFRGRKILSLYNAELCDDETDGLTDEERDQLS